MGRRLDGKVAIVTGAGSVGPGWGNGKAAAVLFAREGARVLAVDLNKAAANETRNIIREEGGEAAVFAGDVSKNADVAAMVAACKKAFGRVDILHNNVGIAVTGGAVDLDEADWDRVQAVNLKSMFLTCKHAIPLMLKNKPDCAGQRGAIVNIGSIAGSRWTGISYIAYSTTKGAILPLTRSIALEYARQGIRANVVQPGLMNTPMVHQANFSSLYAGTNDDMVAARDAQCPTGKMGDGWDVAYAALFLASQEAKYVTGTELVVDGGLTCKYA
jgi:NAD(P)-dependent dehydrogenase (short-subunit alcohol dehydrogenase family)